MSNKQDQLMFPPHRQNLVAFGLSHFLNLKFEDEKPEKEDSIGTPKDARDEINEQAKKIDWDLIAKERENMIKLGVSIYYDMTVPSDILKREANGDSPLINGLRDFGMVLCIQFISSYASSSEHRKKVNNVLKRPISKKVGYFLDKHKFPQKYNGPDVENYQKQIQDKSIEFFVRLCSDEPLFEDPFADLLEEEYWVNEITKSFQDEIFGKENL